jgi:hypothetical protein
MRDGVIAADADQRSAGVQHATYLALDHLPRIRAAVETNVAVIYEPARDAEVNTGFTPDALGVGVKRASHVRRSCGRAPQARRVLILRNA